VTDAIIQARDGRPFAGLLDLRDRCRLAVDDLRALLDVGALDHLLQRFSPAQRAWMVSAVSRTAMAAAIPALTAKGQNVIDLGAAPAGDPAPPRLPAIPERQRARQRYRALGFLPEAHPLSLWDLPPRRLRCKDLTPALKGRSVTIIGFNVTRKQVSATYRNDDEGNPLPVPRQEAMSFVTIEDETGLAETVWFPESYRRFGVCLEYAAPIKLTGKVEVSFGCVSVHVVEAVKV
jgi:DNA polymerase-3 subunit alpha/error-prone DNA polymerase